MACSNLTAGFTLDCNNSNAGVEKVFIANGPVESIIETAGVVTDITVGGVSLTPADFFEFQVPRQSSIANETISVDQVAGTVTYDQQLTLEFTKLSADKRNQILLMAEATSMVVVYKDNNGKYFSVGLERGAYMVSGTATTGTAYADKAGYSIILGGLEAAPSYEVTGSIVE